MCDSEDGVLCTSKEAVIKLVGKRIDDLYAQWLAHILPRCN